MAYVRTIVEREADERRALRRHGRLFMAGHSEQYETTKTGPGPYGAETFVPGLDDDRDAPLAEGGRGGLRPSRGRPWRASST